MNHWTATDPCPHCGAQREMPTHWMSVRPPKPRCPNGCGDRPAPRPTKVAARPPIATNGLAPDELDRLRTMHERGDG